MTNTTTVRKNVEATAKAYAEHVVTGYSRTYGAAKATHDAKMAGLLGGQSPVWTAPEFLALFHVGSKSLLTRWTLLGTVIALGCKDKSQLWLDMVEGNAIDATVVKTAIRDEKATLAKITSAVRKAKAEKAKAEKAKTRAARNPGGTAPANGENGQADGENDVYAKAIAAVSALSDLVKSLDRDQWSTVEGRMDDIRTREQQVRAKADATAKAKAERAAARTAKPTAPKMPESIAS